MAILDLSCWPLVSLCLALDPFQQPFTEGNTLPLDKYLIKRHSKQPLNIYSTLKLLVPQSFMCCDTSVLSVLFSLGAGTRTHSNHTEPYLGACRIWLTATLAVFDSTWPFCGPTAKYQHMLPSIALNANYMLSSRLYWQLMAPEQSWTVPSLIDVCSVLWFVMLQAIKSHLEI